MVGAGLAPAMTRRSLPMLRLMGVAPPCVARVPGGLSAMRLYSQWHSPTKSFRCTPGSQAIEPSPGGRAVPRYVVARVAGWSGVALVDARWGWSGREAPMPLEIGGVPTSFLLPSTPVPHSSCSFPDRTIGTAVEGSVCFYPMTNNAAATVTTGRSQGSNCTFKAVEDMCVTSYDHLKGLIVVIATQFTLSHTHSSLYKSVSTSRGSERQVSNCLLSV